MKKVMSVENGEKINLLTVIGEVSPKITETRKTRMVRCICECGNTCEVSLYHLINNSTKSCGCLLKKMGSDNIGYKHGLCYHPLYLLWRRIIERCHHPKNRAYKGYGARGITVYHEWRNDPTDFIKYIESLPVPKGDNLTIDRINPHGNYEPDNLRWADKTLQSVNKRMSRRNSSGYTGVYFIESRNKPWKTTIVNNGKLHYIGSFFTKEEAVLARNNYIIENNLEILGHRVQPILQLSATKTK